MRWIVETFVKNGFTLVEVIYGLNIAQAAQMYCESSGQVLEVRGNFFGMDRVTFSDSRGRAVVIRREKLCT